MSINPDRTSSGSGAQVRDASPASIFGAQWWRLTLGIVATVFLVAFEALAVATAMPVAVRALDGLPLYALAFSGFLTTALFGMVAAGQSADRRGPRVPLLGGVATFTAGLILAGTALAMPVFLLGRAVQGLGAGMIIVALYVVVGRCYPQDMRPRVFSAMSSAWVLPSIVGPLVAGWLADHASWRLVFLGIAPLVIPAVLLMAPSVRDLDEPLPGVTPRRGRKRLALAAAVGAALLQYAGSHLVWSSLVLVVAGLALLVPSIPRLLPRGSLRLARGLPTTVVMRGILAGAFFGAETFLPLMLIEQRGLSTTLAGLSLVGAAVGWAAGSWYQGRPRLRLPRWRLIQIGCAVVALGIAGLVLALLPALPPVIAAVAWTVSGLGMGMSMSSVSVLTLEQSRPEDQGINSAAVQICDSLGAVTFIGLAGAVFAAAARTGGASAATFAIIWAVMVGVALFGAVVAPRVSPHPPPPNDHVTHASRETLGMQT